MKKLRKGELRFLPKKIDKSFRVYDRAGGSFPYSTGELGTVQQDLLEQDIQAECDRLNQQFVGASTATEAAPPAQSIQPDLAAGDQLPSRKARVPKKKAGPPPGDEVELFKEAEWVNEEDIGDYGDLSDKTDGYVDWKTA